MDESTREIEYISKAVHKDHEIVSYNQLAEDLGVGYKKAQSVLYKYFKANKHQLNASFVIIGVKEGQKIVKWVELESLVDGELEKMDQIVSVQIYSVSLNTYKFEVQDLVMNQLKSTIDHQKLDYYHKLGFIKGPELLPASTSSDTKKPEPIKPVPKQEPKQEPKKDTAKKTSGFSSGLSSHYVSRKQQKSTLDSTNKTSKDQKRAAPEPPKYQYKSRKLENNREKVVVSHDNDKDDFDDDMDIDPPKSTTNHSKEYTTKLNSMFEDDSDEEMEDNEDEKEPIVAEAQEEPQEEEEEPDVMVIDQKETQEEPQQESYEESKESNEPESNEPEYDEDGYLITRAPKSKKAKPPKPSSTTSKPSNTTLKPTPKPTASKPTPKSASSTKNPKKQASLMNFFGKKK